MACLDTTVLVDLLSNRRAARRRRAADVVRRLVGDGEALTTTRFCVAELWVGVYRSREPKRERTRIMRLLRSLEVLEFGERSSRVFGATTARLQKIGRPAGDMDVLIAAVAIANGHALVTRNPRHFADIQGLAVVAY